MTYRFTDTVEPWYKDHLWAAAKVVFMGVHQAERAALKVVFIGKGGLYTKVVFNQGSTVLPVLFGISVVGIDKSEILIIDYQLWTNISNRLSAKLNWYAIPGYRPQTVVTCYTFHIHIDWTRGKCAKLIAEKKRR